MQILDWHINNEALHTRTGAQIARAMGRIPEFILAQDPRPIWEQINERYIGGWNPMILGKWQLNQDNYLFYPSATPLEPLAFASHGTERVFIYPHAFVAIVQADGSFSVARID